jgi:AmmeMemoRadiSam system protein B
VVIGPDHQNLGRDQVTTENIGWSGPNGIVPVNDGLVNKLVDQQLAAIDQSTLADEYGVNSIAPFIHRAWPKAKIVLIAMRGNVENRRVDQLADFLNAELKSNDLVLASVDLSHYKTAAGAWDDDAITMPIIRSIDANRANNVIADSPGAISFILKYAQRQQLKYQELVHTNSAEYLGNLSASSNTSYLTAYFYR